MLKFLWKLAKLSVIYLYILFIYLNFRDRTIVEKYGFFPKGVKWKILNSYACPKSLQNGSNKILIFLFYTLLIFQSYLFVIIPLAIYEGYDWFRPRFLVKAFCSFLVIPVKLAILGYEIFVEIINIIIKNEFKDIMVELLVLAIIIGIPLGCSCLFIYRWFKKQNTLTAWAIAFLGSCYICAMFPSTMVVGDGGSPEGFCWLALPLVNAFYCILCITAWFQRKLWPNNRLAKRIRHFLASLCINPRKS